MTGVEAELSTGEPQEGISLAAESPSSPTEFLRSPSPSASPVESSEFMYMGEIL